jgi:hypothetical protein
MSKAQWVSTALHTYVFKFADAGVVFALERVVKKKVDPSAEIPESSGNSMKPHLDSFPD